MSFLNLALLGGVAAAAVPILVHLISKSQHREVKWGAMHLIELTLKSQQRRIRFENWLLMLLRCLIPILLAVCMARPILKGAAALWSNAKTSLVVVVDNSYSLDYEGTGGTNFELAREAASGLVEGLQRGSDVNVILMSNPDRPLYDTAVHNLDGVASELAEMEAGYGQAQVPQALQHSVEELARMENAQREVVVISDFQRISWSPEEAGLRNHAGDLLAGLEMEPSLTLFHVGSEGRENVCVESLEFSHLLLGVNQTVQVRANLRNYGEDHHDALRVAFHVDGENKNVTQIPLGPGETRQVLFTQRFTQPGSHVVEVSADADSLKADNIFRASLPVWDRVPVLVVDGHPSAEALRSETDFLQIALQPYREGNAGEGLTDLLQSRTVPVGQFGAATIGNARVVVLANVARLTLDQLNDLQAFVRDGGGLMIFAGDQMDLDWYNDRLLPLQLLPTRLAGMRDMAGEPEPFTRVAVRRFQHPALTIFNDQRNGDLTSAEIRQWVRTIDEPDNTLVHTIARLDAGDAFLVEKTFGNGRVLFCASSCDDGWNNLPGRTFFVPFAQRLCTYLASSVMPPRNLDVGEEIVAHFPVTAAGKELTLKDSLDQEHTILVEASGGRGVARFTGTQRPGLYTLEGPDGRPVHFVVNTGRAESDLEQLTGEERETVAEGLRAKLVSSLDEYRELDHSRRYGQEIWKPIFWLVLAILFFELWLERRMARGRVSR